VANLRDGPKHRFILRDHRDLCATRGWLETSELAQQLCSAGSPAIDLAPISRETFPLIHFDKTNPPRSLTRRGEAWRRLKSPQSIDEAEKSMVKGGRASWELNVQMEGHQGGVHFVGYFSGPASDEKYEKCVDVDDVTLFRRWVKVSVL
jgi:hypothetical protein